MPRRCGELAPSGKSAPSTVGDVLYRAGDESYDFLVVLEGAVDIIRPDVEGETLITTHGAGRFLGELNMLTGQRLYLTARVSQPGRVLAVPAHEFRRVMASKPELADTIFSAFVARRELLRTGEGARSVRIIGSRYSSDAMALRAFAARSRVPHTWIDIEDEDDVDVLLAGMGFRTARHPGRDHDHRRPAPSVARRARRASRAHVPPGAGIHVRPRRGRERSRRPGGRGVRGLRGARHRLARRGLDRRPGGCELADRELRRVPERHLRRRARVACGHPGAAARRPAERSVRGCRVCESRTASR